jgi:hypothetical protein
MGNIQRSFGGLSASPTRAAPVGDVPRWTSPSSSAGVTGAFHSKKTDTSSGSGVNGPTSRCSSSRATFGSARRSGFHSAARCSSAARSCVRFGGAGRGTRRCAATLASAVWRSRIFGASVSAEMPLAARSSRLLIPATAGPRSAPDMRGGVLRARVDQ